MEVIDKRKDEKEEKWKKGDVIYFENYDQNIKDFGMIVQEPIFR